MRNNTVPEGDNVSYRPGGKYELSWGLDPFRAMVRAKTYLSVISFIVLLLWRGFISFNFVWFSFQTQKEAGSFALYLKDTLLIAKNFIGLHCEFAYERDTC